MWLRDGYHTDRYLLASFGEHDHDLFVRQCIAERTVYPFHLTYYLNVRLLATICLALPQQPGLARALQLLERRSSN